MNKNFRYDIAILRLLCITIVVFFHAYGMTYVHFSETTNEIYSQKYEFFNQTYLINIAMPMFVFISGFLFGNQLINRPSSFWEITKNKALRLLLPFFIFAIIFMLTTNSLSWRPFYQGTYSHLWFLTMLFWCFIASYLMKPLLLSDNLWISIATLICLFCLMLPDKFIPTFIGLQYLSSYLFWFAFGVFINKHETMIKYLNRSKFLRGGVISWLLSIYLIIVIFYPWEYGNRTFIGSIATICVILGLWLLFASIPWKNFIFTDVLISISAYSFGIYIFHNWIEAYLVSTTAKRLFPLEQFALDNTHLFPLLFSISAFVISLVLTWFLFKAKWGRKLIG